MSKKKKKLPKPDLCPFCGAGRKLGDLVINHWYNPTVWRVCCDRCKCIGPRGIDEHSAIAVWNATYEQEK
jgi:hypothetical protein